MIWYTRFLFLRYTRHRCGMCMNIILLYNRLFVKSQSSILHSTALPWYSDPSLMTPFLRFPIFETLTSVGYLIIISMVWIPVIDTDTQTCILAHTDTNKAQWQNIQRLCVLLCISDTSLQTAHTEDRQMDIKSYGKLKKNRRNRTFSRSWIEIYDFLKMNIGI